MKRFSSGGENGTGVSGAASRVTGPSSASKASSAIGRRDLGPETARARVLVQDEQP